MKRKHQQSTDYNAPKEIKVKLESLPEDSRHPLSFEAIRAAITQIRGKRFIQSNCAEHPALLARFFLHGEIMPSSAGESKFVDYPYQRSFAVETICHKSSKSFLVVEKDNVLFRSSDSTIGSYLPVQFEAIKTEQDCTFIEDKQTYKSVYCSIQELPRKLEQMAGAQGWVCAAIGLSRIKKFTTKKKAEAFSLECNQNSEKFDKGHLLFVYHFTQALNLSLPPKRQVADNQRTLFIELANLNRGIETEGPCIAYSLKDLGFNFTDDCRLNTKPSLLTKGDYFFDHITVTPLRDIKPSPVPALESIISAPVLSSPAPILDIKSSPIPALESVVSASALSSSVPTPNIKPSPVPSISVESTVSAPIPSSSAPACARVFGLYNDRISELREEYVNEMLTCLVANTDQLIEIDVQLQQHSLTISALKNVLKLIGEHQVSRPVYLRLSDFYDVLFESLDDPFSIFQFLIRSLENKGWQSHSTLILDSCILNINYVYLLPILKNCPQHFTFELDCCLPTVEFMQLLPIYFPQVPAGFSFKITRDECIGYWFSSNYPGLIKAISQIKSPDFCFTFTENGNDIEDKLEQVKLEEFKQVRLQRENLCQTVILNPYIKHFTMAVDPSETGVLIPLLSTPRKDLAIDIEMLVLFLGCDDKLSSPSEEFYKTLSKPFPTGRFLSLSTLYNSFNAFINYQELCYSLLTNQSVKRLIISAHVVEQMQDKIKILQTVNPDLEVLIKAGYSAWVDEGILMEAKSKHSVAKLPVFRGFYNHTPFNPNHPLISLLLFQNKPDLFNSNLLKKVLCSFLGILDIRPKPGDVIILLILKRLINFGTWHKFPERKIYVLELSKGINTLIQLFQIISLSDIGVYYGPYRMGIRRGLSGIEFHNVNLFTLIRWYCFKSAELQQHLKLYSSSLALNPQTLFNTHTASKPTREKTASSTDVNLIG